MEGDSSGPNRKRSFFEDDDSSKPPAQKRVRFPKGKKTEPGGEVADSGKVEEDISSLADPRVAAKERSKRRNQIPTELLDEDGTGIPSDILTAEETYEDNENFIEDGIQMEPFNLDKEREEGYFDAEGNYVEYVNDNNEIKDAWLDSVEADPKYVGKAPSAEKDEESVQELSSQDIGNIKRRIADLLEPGETVLQALRRLKGTSNNRKEKMSAETKILFDQLTEDAMKLMDNDVYHEKQEVFQREAEGYERLAQARGIGLSASTNNGNSDFHAREDSLYDNDNDKTESVSDTKESGAASTLPTETAVGAANSNFSTAETSGDGTDAYDMFADDDEPAADAQPSSENHFVPGPSSDAAGQLPGDNLNADSDFGTSQSDYVYDESSGYYYCSSLGYYYDPSTGLYCSAATGQWYSFNEERGTYDEVQGAAPQHEA